jgi:hypothetical protein
MEEYGDLDEETESLPIKRNTQTYPDNCNRWRYRYFTDTGSNNIKNENSHQLAIKLKDLAKV